MACVFANTLLNILVLVTVSQPLARRQSNATFLRDADFSSAEQSFQVLAPERFQRLCKMVANALRNRRASFVRSV